MGRGMIRDDRARFTDPIYLIRAENGRGGTQK